jgi:hypothetical protein
MIETTGDVWDLAEGADALCITTNGTIKADGRGVMGRGVARQALDRYPGLDARLGRHLTANGNVVGGLLDDHGLCPLVAFPVKHAWHEPADLDLIAKSAEALMVYIDRQGWTTVLLPRPGCGNGQRSWAEVKPLIELVLDDRVVVVTW